MQQPSHGKKVMDLKKLRKYLQDLRKEIISILIYTLAFFGQTASETNMTNRVERLVRNKLSISQQLFGNDLLIGV